MLPFTAEQFFAGFARYNDGIWPIQILAYAAGAFALIAAFLLGRNGGRATALMLTVMWLWTGVVYHGLYFAPINPAAHAFAALFVAQAALLLAYAGRLRFAGAPVLARYVGVALIGYAAILYPLVGLAAGHTYPAVPMFGVTPCPVTLFTLGLLLLARSAPWPLFAIPILWSLIGGSAAILLGVPEDWVLLVSGPLAAGLRWRQGGRKAVNSFSRCAGMDRQRMHAADKLRRQGRINHTVTVEPALSPKGLRHDIYSEMGLPARPVAGMASMLVGLVLDGETLRRESLGQLSSDNLLGLHGRGLARAVQRGQS